MAAAPAEAPPPAFDHDSISPERLEVGKLYKVFFPVLNKWRYGVLSDAMNYQDRCSIYVWEPGFIDQRPVNCRNVKFFDLDKDMEDKIMMGVYPEPFQTVFDRRPLSMPGPIGFFHKDFSKYKRMDIQKQLSWWRRKHAVLRWGIDYPKYIGDANSEPAPAGGSNARKGGARRPKRHTKRKLLGKLRRTCKLSIN